MTDEFVIRFDFAADPSEGIAATTIYSGWAGDSLGFAPTLDTAARFATKDIAEQTLQNSYGPEMREAGSVVSA
jgi:hypothetical protein